MFDGNHKVWKVAVMQLKSTFLSHSIETAINQHPSTFINIHEPLGGETSNMFVIFSPIVGEISFPVWLEHIFQSGWFNYQLDIHKVSTTSAASAASNASATSAVSVPGAKREYWQLFLLECVIWLLCNIEDDDDDDDAHDYDYDYDDMSCHSTCEPWIAFPGTIS